MKNNYPIKYALIPMIEQVGWCQGLNELQRDYGEVFYIVSKCYVVKETIEYYPDGESVTKYHVVCPYDYKDYGIWKRCEPSFNLIHGECTNSVIVDKLYDSYEDAVKDKNIKNEDISMKERVYIPYDENFHRKHEEVINKFRERETYYNQLEKAIEEKTSELIVNQKPKKQQVFIYKKNLCKLINKSLYSMMKLYDNEDFIVYTIDDNFFEFMKNDSNVCPVYDKPLIINDGKAKVMTLVSKGKDNKYIYNNGIHDCYDGSLRRISNPGIVFLTTETYQDIIDSYQMSNEDIKEIRLVKTLTKKYDSH